MDIYNIKEDNKNDLIAYTISGVLHALLLLLFLLNFVSYTPKPQDQFGGITIAFGELQSGGDDTNPLAQDETPTDESDVAEEQAEAQPSEPESSPDASSDVESADIESATTEEESPVIADPSSESKKENPTNSSNEKKVDPEAIERAKREAERKARAEAEAKKQAELAAQKKKFSNLFGGGTGSGANTGNQGDPDGDPDKSVLESIGKGSGRIGGGLSERGLLSEPNFSDNSQKTGKVVIKVCVDKVGNVFSAKFTQKGSTTTDTYLVSKAIEGAKKYKFVPSEIEQQCGTVTVDFKVQ